MHKESQTNFEQKDEKMGNSFFVEKSPMVHFYLFFMPFSPVELTAKQQESQFLRFNYLFWYNQHYLKLSKIIPHNLCNKNNLCNINNLTRGWLLVIQLLHKTSRNKEGVVV